MTASELLQFQLDETGKMLRRAFDGVDDRSADFEIGGMMSPRKQAAHLIRCYRACEDVSKGKEPAWETYDVDDSDWGSLMQLMEPDRSRAVSGVTDDRKSIENANTFILGHDHYHIGQLCAIRLAMDPDWNAYAIYGD
jgi:hypothetical protein